MITKLLYIAAFSVFLSLIMIPATFYVWEMVFDVGPSSLSRITFTQMTAELLTLPLTAHLISRHKQGTAFAIGMVITGLATLSFGLATQFYHLIIFSIFCGIGMATVASTLAPLLIHYSDSADYHGFHFGMLGGAIEMGWLVGLLIATFLSGLTIGGMAGWRIAFLGAGCLQTAIGFFGLFAMQSASSNATLEELEHEKSRFKTLFKNPYVLAILGIEAGQVLVWGTLPFLLMLAHLAGLTPGMIIAFSLVMALGTAGGQLIGGRLGDYAVRYMGPKGRFAVGMVSLFFAMFLIILLYRVFVINPENFWLVTLIGFCFGILGKWAITPPMLSQQLSQKMLTHGFALFRLTQLLVVGAGYLLIGAMAEHLFGYKVNGPAFQNIEALVWSLQIVAVVGFSLCLLLCAWLYYKLKCNE